MSTNDIHGIQAGWSVRTADGGQVGSVEETTETYIEVKSGLFGAQHRFLPAATLAHVRPEVKEIGISLTEDEVTNGDWSQPPLELPRTEGGVASSLRVDREGHDPIAAGTVRDPERPIDRNPQA